MVLGLISVGRFDFGRTSSAIAAMGRSYGWRLLVSHQESGFSGGGLHFAGFQVLRIEVLLC